MSPSFLEKLVASLLIVSAELGLWWMSGTWTLSRGFSQLVFDTYVPIFFVLLVIAGGARGWRGNPRGPIREATTGALVGHAITIAAVMLATGLSPGGFERVANTVERESLGTILFTHLVLPAVLGGWLFGAVAFVLVPAVSLSWPWRR